MSSHMSNTRGRDLVERIRTKVFRDQNWGVIIIPIDWNQFDQKSIRGLPNGGRCSRSIRGSDPLSPSILRISVGGARRLSCAASDNDNKSHTWEGIANNSPIGNSKSLHLWFYWYSYSSVLPPHPHPHPPSHPPWLSSYLLLCVCIDAERRLLLLPVKNLWSRKLVGTQKGRELTALLPWALAPWASNATLAGGTGVPLVGAQTISRWA